MTYDLTPVVQALLTLAGAVITCVVVPFIRSKTTMAQQQELEKWVAIAVSAAEQLYQGSKRGKEKKEYVMTWLESRDIYLNDATLDAMVESAVYNLKQNGLISKKSPDTHSEENTQNV